MTIKRRHFNKAIAALLFTYFIQGKTLHFTTAQARARHLTLFIFTPEEEQLLSLLAEAIVPGARKSGLSHYIDYQLNSSATDNMLILKYLGVPAPFTEFYRSALAAFKATCPLFKTRKITDISPNELTSYIEIMGEKNPKGWENAPPAPFFYFVLRSDAVDVTYGSLQGFDDLDIPYMAHIEPPLESWHLPKSDIQ